MQNAYSFKRNISFIIGFSVLLGFSCTSVSAETYWVGITPWQKGQTSDDINRLYIPMFKWLSEKTGSEFKVKAMRSYEDTIEEIADGKIAAAMISPAPYIKAKKKNPSLDILVTELSWNQDKTKKTDSYRSHILVKKDRVDLVDLKSLKGKKFAFVSEESTSGYKVPLSYFKHNKITPNDYFEKVFFLGSHPSVSDAVASGSVDAGATWDYNWKQAIAKNGDVYKAIWTSDPIANLCLVAHPKIPKALREKMRTELLKTPSDLLNGLSTVGFTVRPDSFYDPIRKLE